MVNPLVRAYLAVDGAIMYGVNKAVHGWNWTTGETKAQLANKMLTIAPILMTAGTYLAMPKARDPSQIIPTGAFALWMSHMLQNINTKTEELEASAINRGLLDARAEMYKQGMCQAYGPAFGLVAATGIPTGLSAKTEETRDGTCTMAAGMLAISASFYVMRADYLPPRKSCVERGLEKLADAVREYREQKALEPAMAPIRRFQMEQGM